MTSKLRSLFLSAAVATSLLVVTQPAYAFTDVPSSYWDYTAITYVGTANAWMQDYGALEFKPTALELRKQLARTLVRMFAPSATEDASITFVDIPKTDYWYHYANIATKLGWMPKYETGKWLPDGAIRTSSFDRALVSAMGIVSPVQGLANIHQADGDRYTVGALMPHMTIAHALGLHYNHSTESMDLVPTQTIRRDEVAYSLWRSKTLQSWQISNLSRFNDIELPSLNPSVSSVHEDKQDMTQYALNQIGYPYIWAGEWKSATSSTYCCGTQPQGGMDCSGFVWWVMKRNESSYNAAQFHPSYTGWALPERSSSQMAQYAKSKYGYGSLQIGDLMFFASDGGDTYSSVDHVGLYLGNNWMIHSASSNDGPVIDWVGSGYYYDKFVYARRLIGVAASSRVSTEDIRVAGDLS